MNDCTVVKIRELQAQLTRVDAALGKCAGFLSQADYAVRHGLPCPRCGDAHEPVLDAWTFAEGLHVCVVLTRQDELALRAQGERISQQIAWIRERDALVQSGVPLVPHARIQKLMKGLTIQMEQDRVAVCGVDPEVRQFDTRTDPSFWEGVDGVR